MIKETLHSDQDLFESNGIFYLHFLLLIYDICSPQHEENLWHHHLQWLLRLAEGRRRRTLDRTDNCILEFALMVDAQACLSGNGPGQLVGAHVQQALFRPYTLPGSPTMTPTTMDTQDERQQLHDSLSRFHFDALGIFARAGALAVDIRAEIANSSRKQRTIRMCQSRIAQFQSQLYRFWASDFPPGFAQDAPLAGARLPPRARLMFEKVSPLLRSPASSC